MKKTLARKTDKNISVSAEELAAMLGCGRATAVKIGSQAKAKIQIGRRVLYKLDLVEKYLNEIAGE